MCLHATRERRLGHTPPKHRYAYKVVQHNRSSIYYPGPWRYTDGSKHRVLMKDIRAGRDGCEYDQGLHVFTSLRRARGRTWPNRIIVKVRVDPQHWVASGRPLPGEAVYSRLTVVGKINHHTGRLVRR